jgi:hypothetical protein
MPGLPEMSRRDLLTYVGLGLGAMGLGSGGGALLLRGSQPAEAAPVADEAPAQGHGAKAKGAAADSHAKGGASNPSAKPSAAGHGASDPHAKPGAADPHAPAAPGGADAHAGAAHGAAASHDAEALLLSCMDFRLMDKVSALMAREGLARQYDHVILAGASLVPATDAFPDWNAAFWKHLELALQLHHIRRVVVLDHRDCGAYKLVLGPDAVKDRASETRAHTEHLTRLRADIRAEYPTLRVDLLLMDLDGTVERIA